MKTLKPTPILEAWEHVKRFNKVYIDVDQERIWFVAVGRYGVCTARFIGYRKQPYTPVTYAERLAWADKVIKELSK